MKQATPVMETAIGTVDLFTAMTASDVTSGYVTPEVTPMIIPGVTPVNTPEPQGTVEVTPETLGTVTSIAQEDKSADATCEGQEDTTDVPEMREVPGIPELPKQSDESVTSDSEESDEFVVPEPKESHGFMAPGPVPKVKTASTSTQIYPLPPPPSYRKQVRFLLLLSAALF